MKSFESIFRALTLIEWRRDSTQTSTPPGKRRFPSGVIGIFTLIAILDSGGAYAFGGAPVRSGSFPKKKEAAFASPMLSSSDRFNEGSTQGAASAARITRAVAQKTIELQGCAGIDEYEAALLRIVRSLRPPQTAAGLSGSEADFVEGYFSGYYSQIRGDLHAARDSCQALHYKSGQFPGELGGSYLCVVAQVSKEWVHSTTYIGSPLYAGWSGGSIDVENECYLEVDRVLRQCPIDFGVEVRELRMQEVCTAEAE
jgi:hypothetical protein